jgi:hypothetical protein
MPDRAAAAGAINDIERDFEFLLEAPLKLIRCSAGAQRTMMVTGRSGQAAKAGAVAKTPSSLRIC